MFKKENLVAEFYLIEFQDKLQVTGFQLILISYLIQVKWIQKKYIEKVWKSRHDFIFVCSIYELSFKSANIENKYVSDTPL